MSSCSSKRSDFTPSGFVMGSSIYHTGIQTRKWNQSQELTKLTEAMYNARELAMTRMEEEAAELGADGVVGVRLDVNYYEWGKDAAEFIAVGTAVKAEDGVSRRNELGKPFTSDLSGQDFWTLSQTGYAPQGPRDGHLRVPHCPPRSRPDARHDRPERRAAELHPGPLRGTRARHDPHAGRSRLDLGASGIVGVRLEEKSHQWGSHTIEFLALGTAVTKSDRRRSPSPSPPRSSRSTTDDDPSDLPEAAERRLTRGPSPRG